VTVRDYDPEDCAICGRPIAFMSPATTTEKGGVHKRCLGTGTDRNGGDE